MHKLFEKTKLGTLDLANSFVRSATWEGCGTESGLVTKEYIKMLKKIAKGNVGTIITGQIYVSNQGKASPFQIGLDRDECIDGLKELTTVIHSYESKIFAQLAHGGAFAESSLSNEKAISLSEVLERKDIDRKIATIEDINQIVEQFLTAAVRAKKANFDGIQIHAAHGYLISQSLSSYFNNRNDKFGGDFAKRTYLIKTIISEIRKEVGEDFPIIIKINCSDFIENGLEVTDTINIINSLPELSAVEVSGGLLTSRRLSPTRRKIKNSEDEAYFKDEAKKIKNEINIPLILVGGFRSKKVMKEVYNEGICDFISLSRPFIMNPNLVDDLQTKKIKKSKCVSCNKCFRPGMKGEGIECIK